MKRRTLSFSQRLRVLRRAFQPVRTVLRWPAQPLTQRSVWHTAVTHPDNGPFIFGMLLNEPLPLVASSFDLGARLTITFRSADKDIQFSCGEDPTPFWSGSNGGLIFLRYHVPEDVPAAAELEVNVVTPAKNDGYAMSGGTWFIDSDHTL